MSTGIDAQIGFAEESVYGTRVVPARFLEFNEESVQLNKERIESQGLRAGRKVTRHWIDNKKGAGGAVSLEVMTKGYGLIFKHMMGATAMTTPVGGTLTRDHTATLGQLDGKSLTCQIGRPPVGAGAADAPFDYLGCKVSEWELSNDVDGLLMLSLTFDAQDEKTDQSLAVASYASGITPLSFLGGKLQMGPYGGALGDIDVTNFSVSGNNGLKTDRYYIRQNPLKKEPLEATERRTYEGNFTADFESLTAYNYFANGAEAQLQATWQGPLIEGSLYYQVQVTMPRVRVEGETPNVGGPDTVSQPIGFKVLDDPAGAASPITIVYRTTDTTP